MTGIRIEDSRFTDPLGRTLMLRGISVDGACKYPVGPGFASDQRRFFDHRRVSFVGHPFPLEEADLHFRRLASWGFTLVRLLVTWEAVEHAGPGLYDREYLEYLRAIVEKAAGHGLSVLIDPHQDVWSRFCGGDGAPGWTLEAAGFDLTGLEATGAAVIAALHEEPPPPMSWPANGSRLAAATMFSLFFGGSVLAPDLAVDGEPIQDFLQRRYTAAFAEVARSLGGLPNVAGYETMNEPLPGWIGRRDLHKPGGTVLLGPCPSPLQAMALGSGIPCRVGSWRMGALGFARDGHRLLDPGGRRAWAAGRECAWKGVWDLDGEGKPFLVRPDHFRVANGRALDFGRDCLPPFFRRFAAGIRAADPEARIFLEADPGSPPPELTGMTGIAFAPHWYDGTTLMRKRYSSWFAANTHTRRPVFGRRRIRRSFRGELLAFKDWARERLGGVPVLLGEFGIPFDLSGGRAYRTGDYRFQERALDRSFIAVEDSLSHAVLYNYTSSNTNRCGDGWNGEDLSLFSADQGREPGDINSGGRALGAAVRPYPAATAGRVLKMSFDMKSRVFTLVFTHEDGIQAPTEIFVPALQYPKGFRVEASDGRWEVFADRLLYRHATDRREHRITIRPL